MRLRQFRLGLGPVPTPPPKKRYFWFNGDGNVGQPRLSAHCTLVVADVQEGSARDERRPVSDTAA